MTLSESEFRKLEFMGDFIQINRLFSVVYYVAVFGLYLLAKHKPYLACNYFFIINLFCCFYIFFEPISSDTITSGLLLLISYLANLQAHSLRRTEKAIEANAN